MRYQSAIIAQAHELNARAYWQAVNAKTPLVSFGGVDMDMIRFHNVSGCPFTGLGFIGRDWFIQQA